MSSLTRAIILITAVIALVASWVMLGRVEAQPAPGDPTSTPADTATATNTPTQTPVPPHAYLPLIAQPPVDTPDLAVTPTTGATATRTAVPPPATPALPPPDFASCAFVGDPARAPNYPVRITGIDKVAETVTLQNVSASPVDLTGWTMCSVTGGQTHDISGVLGAGATQTFGHAGGPIWNNTSSDPGALWTPEGNLASYWPD
jgi:hypothetical protein